MVSDDTVFTGGLLTNGDQFYSGLTKTGFYIWLFESTDQLKVSASYSGEELLETGNLTITETSLLWTMLLTIILAVAAAVLCVFIYILYDRTYQIEKAKKNVFLGLSVIVILSSIPLMLGTSISGGDLIYHLHRIEGVKDGLLSGQFPVRLEPEWVHGHGYANGIFYCNSLLFFPAVLRLLGFPITASFNLYCMGLNIATALIAYVSFEKIFRSRVIGLMCSALYTLSIFRIYKLLVVVALGEGTALTFLPLILYGFYTALTGDIKDKKYKDTWIPIALGFAGLVQAHVLTTEITAVLVAILCVIVWKRVFRRETFLVLAKGAAGAALASLWYLVPFLDYYIREDIHIKYISDRTIQERGLYPAQLAFNYWKFGTNPLGGEAGMQHSHAQGLGLIFVVTFCVAAILWFSGRWKAGKNPLSGSECKADKSDMEYHIAGHPIIALGKFGTAIGGALMLMSLVIFPWDKIQAINGFTASMVSSIQFPNRLLGWGTALLTAVFGCCIWYFKNSGGKIDENEVSASEDKSPKAETGNKNFYYAGVICMLLAIAASSMYYIDYTSRDSVQLKLYNGEGMGFGYISGAEYLIEGTDEEELFYKPPVAGRDVVIGSYTKKYLHVKMECSNTGSLDSYVELPILYYTGYQAVESKTGQKLKVVSGENNVVRVLLPPGFSGSVEVQFVSPIHWRISEIISWVFIAGVILLLVFKRHKTQAAARRQVQ